MGLTQIARTLRLSKTTTHGILSTLVKKGYLTKDPETKTFSIGPSFIVARNQALESNFKGSPDRGTERARLKNTVVYPQEHGTPELRDFVDSSA